MRSYAIIKPKRGKLRRKIATSALRGKPLKIEARERLDELSVRRRSADTIDLKLEILSIHPHSDDKYINARLMDSSVTARIDFTDEAVTLTVSDFSEADATP